MKSEAVIEIQGLIKGFGKGSNRITAVNNLNLSIQRGQVYGVLGPNGAGKTTTIRMLSGLLKPDAGTLKINGYELIAGKAKNNHRAIGALGICPQELVIWNGLTLMEQLLFMARMYEIPQRVAVQRAHTLLEAMGLTEKKDKLGGTLSGGMKRRLNLLLGLMHDPEILILDEPQAGLDPQSRVLIREYISNLSKSKTVLMTTHDMEEADKVCDRVAIIDHGGIIVENTPVLLKENLFQGEFVEFELENISKLTEEQLRGWQNLYGPVSIYGNVLRFTTSHPVALIETLQAQMKSLGWMVSDIKIRKASLEDVFIELTGRGLRE